MRKNTKTGIFILVLISVLLTGCGIPARPAAADSDAPAPESEAEATVPQVKQEEDSAAYEYYLTKEELLEDIDQGYIFCLDTAFESRPMAPQGISYTAPFVSEGNWDFYVHEENNINLEIAFSNLHLKPKETIFPMGEQVIVEVISPEEQTVYRFEKTGDEITEDTSIQEQISVTEGKWTLRISFAYVCGEAPSKLKIAAAYEAPSERDIDWLKTERLNERGI